MDFRRGNRRRRALLDDRLYSLGAAPLRTTRRSRRDRTYTDRALLENQPRVTDLIPKWDSSLGFWFIVGAAAVAGATALHIYAEVWARVMNDVSFTFLRFGTPGGLPAWLATIFLLAAGGYAGLTYHLRRYRIDDYRGAYIVWLWAAVLWVVASVDAGGALYPVWQSLFVRLSGIPLLGDGAVWPWLIGGLVYLLAVTRLAIDAWRCRAAVTLLAVATALYVAAGVVSLGALSSFLQATLAATIAGAVHLAGHFLLAFAHMVNARHVYLDAQGFMPQRREGKRDEQDDDEDDLDDDELEALAEAALRAEGVDPTSVALRQADMERIASSLGARVDPAHIVHDVASQDLSHLSKAERKRLKRMMRRE